MRLMESKNISVKHVRDKQEKILPPPVYSEKEKERILKADQERSSLGGLQRTFGVDRNTVAKWIKKK